MSDTQKILELVGQLETKLKHMHEALVACRQHAQRERMDYRVIIRMVDTAIGPETGPENSREEMSPVLNGTLDAAAERLAAATVTKIKRAVEAVRHPGDTVIEIGRLCDAFDDMTTPAGPACEDCGRPYDDPGFVDLVIPSRSFARISTTGDGNGLLCPSCLIARVAVAGIRCDAMFSSGPVRLVEYKPRAKDPAAAGG